MSSPKAISRLPGPLRSPIALILAAGVLGGILYLTFRGGAKHSLPPTAFYEVKRGDFIVSIVEGGTIEAVNEVVIRNEVEGTARIIYIVPEGSYVEEGDRLVELDSSQAQDQVNQQEIAWQKAQFAFLQAQAQLDIQRSQTNSDIDAALLKLRLAELDLDKFMRGDSKVQLIEATNSLVTAEAQLAVSEENYMWTTNLTASGYETKQRADQDRLSLINAENKLTAETNKLWILSEFTLQKSLEQFRSDVRQASNELQRVVAQSESRMAQYEADLLTQSNTLDLSLKKLERDRKNLDGCLITAPQDGLVVYPSGGDNRFSSESLIEEGATVRNRQELIKLPDTSRMKVSIKVHESFINMVEKGQQAFVVLDSMPDQRFRAVVDKVALLPDTQSRWGNPNLKVYKTEILILDPLPDVKPGVSAKAEVIVSKIENAVSVPIQAVTTLGGRQVCYVQQGGAVEPVPVEVGMFNTKFIEVTEGLEEGDKVLLAPPFDTKEKGLDSGLLTEGDEAALTNTPPPAPRQTSNRPGNGMGPSDRSAEASAGPGGDRGGMGSGGAMAGMPNMQDMVRQFDKNGDGELDDSEREAMRAEIQQRMGAMGGPGGGGQGGPGGGFNREEMLKQFDKDGDGQLSEEERTAMREQFGGRRGGGQGAGAGMGPGGGRGQGGGGQGPGGGGFGGQRGGAPSQ